VNIKVPALAPELVGANFTETPHEVPGASFLPGVHPDRLILKPVAAVIVTDLIVIERLLVPGLISLTLERAPLPTLTVPNDIEVRETTAITGFGVGVGIGVAVRVAVAVGVAV
jgi:hypothetical protein